MSDPVEQLAAAEHPARTFHEELEQPIFGRPELQRLAAALDFVRYRIELEVTHLDRLARQRRTDAAHDSGDAGE